MIHLALAGWSAYGHFVNVDEAGHIASGVAHWQTGNFRPYSVNPPLPRMVATLPIWLLEPKLDLNAIRYGAGGRPEWDLGRSLARDNQHSYLAYVRCARFINLLWTILAIVIIYRWASELYSPWAGVFCCALWCFEPMVIAMSSTVLPDVPCAATLLFGLYLTHRYVSNSTWHNAITMGLCWGLCVSTKNTILPVIAVLLFAFVAVKLWQMCKGVGHCGATSRDSLRWRHLLVSSLFAYLILNLTYGFSELAHPLKSFQFVSETLGASHTWHSNTVTTQPGNRFEHTLFGHVPVMLPASYIRGIDIQKRDFEVLRPCYLNGEIKRGGWWYYYLYGMSVKLPVAVIVIVLLSLSVWPRESHVVWRPMALFLAPAVVVIAFVSSQTGLNLHLRYILPAYPLLFLFTGRLVPASRQRIWFRFLLFILVIWLAVATLRVAPHFMSYFNPIAGGPEHGYQHLLDSNSDWGQDLLYFKKWYNSNPQAHPIGMAYNNIIDPQWIGIDYYVPPPVPVPGWYALDVAFTTGYLSSMPNGHGTIVAVQHQYKYFSYIKPVHTIGYTINIYYITGDEANRVRELLALPLLMPSLK